MNLAASNCRIWEPSTPHYFSQWSHSTDQHLATCTEGSITLYGCQWIHQWPNSKNCAHFLWNWPHWFASSLTPNCDNDDNHNNNNDHDNDNNHGNNDNDHNYKHNCNKNLFFTNDGSKEKTFDNGNIDENNTPVTETPKMTTNPSMTKTANMTTTMTETTTKTRKNNRNNKNNEEIKTR